jgi:hypothetical protein
MSTVKDTYLVDKKSTSTERTVEMSLVDKLNQTSIPDDEIMPNLGLFLKRHTLSRIIFMHEIYQKIIEVNGSIFEFGVRWGQNMALFESFRAIYEPYNYTRKIIGFDTFTGFPGIDRKDGSARCVAKNAYSVTSGYERELESILEIHEKQNPIPHIKTTRLVKGDVTETLPEYLKNNPETLIAFAYFDFDIYKPTKDCLELIKKHTVKGAVIAFDELNHNDWPGETVALKEVFDVKSLEIKRLPCCPYPSYFIL